MPHAKANDIQIHYELSGPADAPVVMLSNSLGTRLEMWDPQMPALTRRYRVLRYDSRGHGRSDAPPGPYSIALLGQDALALLDALGIARVHFCGLSKGGMVGQWLGAHHGDRLLSLTLCATAARVGTAELWNQRIEQSAREGMAALVDGVIERWFTAGYRATRAARARAGARHDPRDPAAGLRRLLRRDPRHGPERGDPLDPHAHADRRRRRRSGHHGRDDARRCTSASRARASSRSPQAAHLLNIEQTERFNRTLTGFLDAQARD